MKIEKTPLTWRERIDWWDTFAFDPHLPCPYAYVFGCLFVWRNKYQVMEGWYWPTKIRFAGFAPD